MTDDTAKLLADLASREAVIGERVEALLHVPGHSEESAEYQAIFAEYKTIHSEYVAIAVADSSEALKRALFLQWFQAAEPWWLSGIGNLDRGSEQTLLTLIDKQCLSGSLDSELEWMLPYYYLIAPYYFEHEAPHLFLVAYCHEHQKVGRVEQPPDFASEGRGQMGDYWKSIFR